MDGHGMAGGWPAGYLIRLRSSLNLMQVIPPAVSNEAVTVHPDWTNASSDPTFA